MKRVIEQYIKSVSKVGWYAKEIERKSKVEGVINNDTWSLSMCLDHNVQLTEEDVKMLVAEFKAIQVGLK